MGSQQNTQELKITDPEELVDGCLDLMGPLQVESKTRQEIIDHVSANRMVCLGEINSSTIEFSERVSEVLQLVASSREFQMG